MVCSICSHSCGFRCENVHRLVRNHGAHVRQVEKGRTPHFIGPLLTELLGSRSQEPVASGSSSTWNPQTHSLASARRETHVCIEPHDENGLNTVEMQPLLHLGSRKSAKDFLFEKRLTP